MSLYHGKHPIPVLFENEFFMVLNKPSGLSVQGGAGVKISLDSILSQAIHPRPLLLHRLDKDTSGIILVAKTKQAAAELSPLFANSKEKLVKQYLGLCSGIIKPKQGTIDHALDLRKKGQIRVQTKSKTRYKTVSQGSAGELSFCLLELELVTGRMHQIRRHLAFKGHPLFGDDRYGDFALNKTLRKNFSLKHLLLHASRLIIPPLLHLLPQGLDITAPLPEYFSRFLEALTPSPVYNDTLADGQNSYNEGIS